MKKLYNLKTVEKDSHHMFTYEDGKKTPIPDDGVVFCYLAPETENGRMLKATEWPDRAGAIDGKFVCTDEITNDHSTPCVDGESYNIWGIGSDESGDYVVTSARGTKFYINAKKGVRFIEPLIKEEDEEELPTEVPDGDYSGPEDAGYGTDDDVPEEEPTLF